MEATQSLVNLADESEFWVDETGMLGIDALEQRQARLPFRLRHVDQPHLIDGKALWLRFDVRMEDTSVRWQLELPLAGVDLATLYYRDDQGHWVVQRAGDSLPLRAWPQAGRYPVFSLSNTPQKTTRYFLQIIHARVPFSAGLQIVSDSRMTTQHEKEQFFLGAYFGLAALVVVLAAANALAFRDSGFGSYAVYVALLAAAQAAFTGVAAQYLWPGYPQLSNAGVFFLPLMAAATGMWFVRTVTTPRQFSPALDRFVLALVGLLVAAGLIDVLFPTSEGFAVTNTLLTGSMLVMLSVIVLSVFEGDRDARWVALGFLPVMIAAMFPLLRNFGLISSGFLTEYGLTLGSAIETPILFYGLHRRLSVRREAQARARALSQTDPLTGLAHARILLLRLQGALVRAVRYHHQSGLLLVNLSNHGALLREHGGEAAERSLVLAASRLRAVARDVDTAARVGDHQFALLIEGPTTLQETQDIAMHAVARGLRESDILPGGASLKFHIAITMLPAGALDAQTLLARLQDELRQMEPDARKTIRVASFGAPPGAESPGPAFS
nr:7TM diverse intracellular signaling domain-containing protein [Variovorax terrae]